MTDGNCKNIKIGLSDLRQVTPSMDWEAFRTIVFTSKQYKDFAVAYGWIKPIGVT